MVQITTPGDERPAQKKLILFVHGLGGDATETWGEFPHLIRHDPVLGARFDVGSYSFPTSLFRLPFCGRAPKLQELADGLKTQIDNRYADYRRIVLICHSLGGLIARKYLVEEVKEGSTPKVTHLMLFAVPNDGTAIATIANFISWRHNQLRQLCRGADILEALNDDWITFRMRERLRLKFVVAALDRVVDPASVRGTWGNSDVETIVDRNHRNVVKPRSTDDDAFIILKRFVLSPARGRSIERREEDYYFDELGRRPPRR